MTNFAGALGNTPVQAQMSQKWFKNEPPNDEVNQLSASTNSRA